MLPGTTRDDRVDVRGRKTVALREQSRARSVGRIDADVTNVLFGQSAATSHSPRVGRFDLVEVIPGLASDRVPENSHLDAVGICDGLLGLAGLRPLAGVDHDGIGENSRVVGLASLVALTACSTPLTLVAHVVGMGAILKVLGSHAGRIVAFVPSMIGDCAAISEGKSHSVSAQSASALPTIAMQTEESILFPFDWTSASRPFPARIFIINDVNLGPKSHLHLGEGERARLEQVSFLLSDANAKISEFIPYFGDLLFHLSYRFPTLHPTGKGPQAVVIMHGAIVAGVETCQTGVLEPRLLGL